MRSPLNIAAFLAPISHQHTSGEDLRYSEDYDRIKEARRADEQLDQGEWRTDIKTADWREVARQGRIILIEKSKDLQIAVWLVEAWVHLHGFAGLAAGLDLVRRLLQTFWSTLYPRMEDGDMEYRIGPLALLKERLPTLVCQTPLCDPAHTNGYGYFQWEESRQVGLVQNADKEQKKRREDLLSEGKISGEAFASAVNAGSVTYYRNITQQLHQSREALAALDEVTTDLFAPDPPGFSALMEAIEACSRVAEGIFKEKCKSEVAPPEDPPANSGPLPTLTLPDTNTEDDPRETPPAVHPASINRNAIDDICAQENDLWMQACRELAGGHLREAMDQLICAAALAPSVREKNRYQLLLAKLCLKADRPDLAGPIAEELYKLIDTLKLEQWEHPSWIAEVVETLYRCLAAADQTDNDRAKTLFQKLCLLNVTKAAAYRIV